MVDRWCETIIGRYIIVVATIASDPIIQFKCGYDPWNRGGLMYGHIRLSVGTSNVFCRSRAIGFVFNCNTFEKEHDGCCESEHVALSFFLNLVGCGIRCVSCVQVPRLASA